MQREDHYHKCCRDGVQISAPPLASMKNGRNTPGEAKNKHAFLCDLRAFA